MQRFQNIKRGNALFLVAAGVLIYFLLRRLGMGAIASSVAASAALLNDEILRPSIAGMESSLFLALVFGGLWALSSGRDAMAVLLASLATLARPEGVFVLAVVIAAKFLDPATRKLADVSVLSRTVVFADSAQVRMTSFFPPAFSFEENWILDPPSNNFPTVHFRHDGSANVAFLDGHVESRARHYRVDIPGANFLSAAQAALMEQNKLGYVSDGNLDNPTLQDDLYDRR